MAELKNSTLDDIAAVAGFTATVRLAAHYGGRDMNVPKHVSELHPIAKLVGLSVMTRLCAEWPGERVAVPKLTFAEAEIRNAEILIKLREGMGVDEISRNTGVTTRRLLQLRRVFENDGLLPLVFQGKAEPENQVES
jgi:hypothetical protein